MAVSASARNSYGFSEATSCSRPDSLGSPKRVSGWSSRWCTSGSRVYVALRSNEFLGGGHRRRARWSNRLLVTKTPAAVGRSAWPECSGRLVTPQTKWESDDQKGHSRRWRAMRKRGRDDADSRSCWRSPTSHHRRHWQHQPGLSFWLASYRCRSCLGSLNCENCLMQSEELSMGR